MRARLQALAMTVLLGGAPVLGAEAPPASAPERLSETGLYAGPGTSRVDPRNLPYAPQYPLWSDGAVKSRWIRLPERSTIDTTDVDAWSFPIGTKLWKEFAFGGRRVETRFIWRASERQWVFATYLWSDDGQDAVLAPEAGVRDYREIAPGKRISIPGIAECRACHASGRSIVLGFTALQLSDDRDPMAPHAEPIGPEMTTLRSLVAAGRLAPDRRDLVEDPPRIRAGSPRERAVLGYLTANCGHCHNATGPIAHVGLVLAHDASGAKDAPEPGKRTTVGVAGSWIVPGTAPESSRRVAPGEPERSALLYRMRSRRPASQMPPLGTVIADDEAVRLVEGWIEEDLSPAPVAAHR